MVPLVPVIVPWVAEMVRLPAVVNVALKVPTPLLKGLAGGSLVLLLVSVLEKVTLPVNPVAVLLNWSSAVTVKVKPLPAVAVPGAVTRKCVAAAALTVMGPLVPVTVVWLAVMVRLPAVVNVALKVATPLVKGLAAGSTVLAPVSVLEKVTLPVKPVAVLLNRSSATTVKVKLLPATVAAGALTIKCDAAAALTAIALLAPVMLLVVLSVAVSVWLPAVVKVTLNVPTPLVRVTLF
jgi:hypothetical protein